MMMSSPVIVKHLSHGLSPEAHVLITDGVDTSWSLI